MSTRRLPWDRCVHDHGGAGPDGTRHRTQADHGFDQQASRGREGSRRPPQRVTDSRIRNATRLVQVGEPTAQVARDLRCPGPRSIGNHAPWSNDAAATNTDHRTPQDSDQVHSRGLVEPWPSTGKPTRPSPSTATPSVPSVNARARHCGSALRVRR